MEAFRCCYGNDVCLSHVTHAWLPEHPISGVAVTSLIGEAATSEMRRWVTVASVRKLIAQVTLRDGRQWLSKRVLLQRYQVLIQAR